MPYDEEMRSQVLKKIAAILLYVFFTAFITSSHSALGNTLCNNGTISKSSGRGTCSWNGGIAGGSSSSKSNGSGYKDPWGSSSSSKKNNGFGYSDPYGSSSRNSRFCSYIDRNKGRC